MHRYVALLRGINVGRAKRVAMSDLRELLAGLGFEDVRTHLQSGNALFSVRRTDPDRLARKVEQGIDAALGMTVRCLVRDGADLKAVVAGHPLADVANDGARMMALFLSARPDPALVAAHDPAALDPGRVVLGDKVIYQWCPDGVLASAQVSAYVEKHLGVTVTARNWNTVTRLSEMLDE
jgi:uncharacterized protein (DUF1697 family)